MGMTSRGMMGAIALASCSMAYAAPTMASIGTEVLLISASDKVGPQVVIDASRIDRDTIEVRRSLPRDGQRRRRAKGPQAKPRKRSNRLHVSKRTRRKHRRAA